MKPTGDLSLVKKINKSLVLDFIRTHSPISRARIAELSGLTKATVSSLVNELIESHLTYEIGVGQSSGGRKPMMLLFNGKAGFAIGIDLGVNYIFTALTDLNGAILEEYRVSHRNESVEQVFAKLTQSIREMISRAPESTYGIVGIGIGIPGISDEEGNVLFAPNLGWDHVPLQSMLEEAFDIPVVIDNEANTGAVGEKQFGVGQSASHLVYISIGMGIGTGIIINHELYRGSSGFSGELGHMSIHFDGRKCPCGNYGCWELYASEHALLEQARTVLGIEDITVEALLKLADEGDAEAVRLFERLAYYLSAGIVSIINGFNPESIIIGGRLADAQKWLRGPMLEALEKRSLPYPRAQLNVQFSELGIRATILGACSFAITKFFASAELNRFGPPV